MKSHFKRVEFARFKAFSSFRLDLRRFNILVGPNNAGKSTVLTAFRILAAAMRRASSKNPTLVQGPHGPTQGYNVDLKSISVAEENIFFNYDNSNPATITFHLSNNNKLILYFPEQGACTLLPDAQGVSIYNTKQFRENFNCSIGFVPILGPVEPVEPLFGKEAARLALFNYRAARNFRNIWYHYPQKFEKFRQMLVETWPNMDISRPELDYSHGQPRLYMYCSEERITRELFWSGFGFQVWCQMLTHLIQSEDVSVFLIDEPDIYLHSELQRQLLNLLKNLGPDILLATHSTEIITEAEADDIVLIDKKRRTGQRIRNPIRLQSVFSILGSNLNPILTHLAKTRRVLFVEGDDFQILSKFASKLGEFAIGNRQEFAVMSVKGFNPEKMRNIKLGIEAALGTSIVSAAILDRDFRCKGECDSILESVREFCKFATIHKRKEIENFLLVFPAIDRAVFGRIKERAQRTGKTVECKIQSAQIFEEFAESRKYYVASQLWEELRRFARGSGSGIYEGDIHQAAHEEFDRSWNDPELRLNLVPGKEALRVINTRLSDVCGISVTPSAIIDAMRVEEIPKEVRELISILKSFSSVSPDIVH